MLQQTERDLRIPCFLNSRAGNAAAAAELIGSDPRFKLLHCDPSELGDAVRAAVANGIKRIAIAGGDGSIAAAAGVVAGTGVELGIVPGGTLNHFARRLGIPGNVKKAVDLAAEAPSRHVNVGYVNDLLFLNSSSFGVYVDYVHARDRWKPRFGYYLGSTLAFFRTLVRLPIYTVYVDLEGRRRKYRTPLVFIGVDERGLKLPALGDPVEGGRSGLHVLVLKGWTRRRVLRVAFEATARGIRMVSRTPHLESFVADMCTIELSHSRPYVAVDGETVRLRAPFRYRIGRNDLTVVAPPRKEEWAT